MLDIDESPHHLCSDDVVAALFERLPDHFSASNRLRWAFCCPLTRCRRVLKLWHLLSLKDLTSRRYLRYPQTPPMLCANALKISTQTHCLHDLVRRGLGFPPRFHGYLMTCLYGAFGRRTTSPLMTVAIWYRPEELSPASLVLLLMSSSSQVLVPLSADPSTFTAHSNEIASSTTIRSYLPCRKHQ